MKKLLFLATSMLLAFGVSAQVDSAKTDPTPVTPDPLEEEIWQVVEESPEYPGGKGALDIFLRENVRYPQQALKNGITGRCFVTFVVEKDGSVSNVKVLRDIGGGCGAEAVRVVESMPKWKPGKQRGKVVRCQFSLPIQFSQQ